MLIAFQIGVFGVVLSHHLVHERGGIGQVIAQESLQRLVQVRTDEDVFDPGDTVDRPYGLATVLRQGLVLFWVSSIMIVSLALC